MKRKIINIICPIMTIGMLVVGCAKTECGGTDTSATQSYLANYVPTGFEYIKTIDKDYIIEIRNKETGAHYYYIDSYRGYYTLTPVITSDGQFKVTQ